ncbi:MAG: hypothetical protein EA396_10175 [Anaerolineaceae bacterium]|nr:MAG: hypothetical protein EA396_10175 [Anaerolineaceae bacterium]
MVKRLALVIFCIAATVTWTHAVPHNLPPSAYVAEEGLVVDTGTRRVIGGGMTEFSHLTWRADGRFLLFQRGGGGQVALYDDATGETRQLTATGAFLPATFSHDGTAVIYTADPAHDRIVETGGRPMLPVTVYRAGIDDGAVSALGEVMVGVGCGGGSPFPMDAVYNKEAGFGGRGLIMADTPHGLLYSMSCTGIGLGVFDTASGESRGLGDGLSRPQLSPDGGRVLASDELGGGLVILNLADGGQQTVGTSAPVDQIAWNTDGGAIFYSTRTLSAEALPLSAEEAGAVANALGLPPDGVPQYQVSVRRLDPASGAESVIFSEPAWAIGRMTGAGGAVFFSVISNGETWVEALANGTVDPFAPDSFGQAWRSVEITVLRVAEGGGDAVALARGAHQMTLRP